MGRPRPIYNEIKAIRNLFDDIRTGNYHGGGIGESRTSSSSSSSTGSSIKKCREAYIRLLELLTDPTKRRQLGEEAIPDEMHHPTNNNHHHHDHDTTTTTTTGKTTSATNETIHSRTVRMRQRLALSEMWKSLLSSSILCMHDQIQRTIQQQQQRTRHRKRNITTATSSNSSNSGGGGTTGSHATAVVTTKYHEADIHFPFKLLQLCFKYDPIFDTAMIVSRSSSSSSFNGTQRNTTTNNYQPPPQQQPPPNFSPSKLGKEQSKLLYNYCIDLMSNIDQEREQLEQQQNDNHHHNNNNNNNNNYQYTNTDIDTKNIDDVERLLLKMILFMCGRTELVAYYKPLQHIRYILNHIVQPRLLRHHRRPSHHRNNNNNNNNITTTNTTTSDEAATIVQTNIYALACKIWYTLFHTCSRTHLGIGLQYNIIESYDIFTLWCQQQLVVSQQFQSSSSSSVSFLREETAFLLNTMALLMQNDPDFCIVSLQRHGSTIVPFLQQCYQQYHQRLKFSTTTIAPSHHNVTTALHRFLLQYIIVCQEAGTLQGCISCDLGDLGKGSLSHKTIFMFLDILITAVIPHLNSSNNDKLPLIDSSYKMLLEVTVRLLNVAQRIFLVQNEWMDIDDRTQMIIDYIKQQPDPYDYYCTPTPTDDIFPTCSGVVLSESPFIKYILRPIHTTVATTAVATTLSEATDSPTLLQQAISVTLDDDALSVTAVAMNDKRLIAILHIMCAAAELFPLGSCWTTSTQGNWRVLTPYRDDKTSLFPTSLSPPDDLITMKGCSAWDLSTIIDLLGNVLAHYGSHSSSADVQKWSIRTLIGLVVTTDELYNDDSITTIGTNDRFVSLGNAWKRIWKTIHNTNYCYSARTTCTSNGSVGDLLLQLLIRMIRYSCTDPPKKGSVRSIEFLVERRSDIWNLKVFEQFQIHSPTIFILINTTLSGVGEKDDGRCSIGLVAVHDDAWQSRVRRYGNGLRSKLLCYCLHFLTMSIDCWINDAMMSALSTCIAGLINGFLVPAWSTTSAADQSKLQSLNNLDDDIETPQNTLNANDCHLNEYERLKHLFESLWCTQLLDVSACHPTIYEPKTYSFIDRVRLARRLVHAQALQREMKDGSVSQAVVQLECSRFLTLFKEDVGRILIGCNSSSVGYDVDECEDAVQNLLLRIPIVKLTLTVMLSRSTNGTSILSNFALDEVSGILNEASSILSSCVDRQNNVNRQNNLNLMTTNVIQLVRGLVMAHPGRGFGRPECFTSAASVLYTSCIAVLENCAVIDCNVNDDDDDPQFEMNDLDEGEMSDSRGNLGNEVTQRKRKWHSKSRTHSRTKAQSFWCSRSTLFLISALTVELNPVYKNFEFVTRRLLGVDVLESFQESELNVDILGGLFAIVILLSKTCRSVPEMDEERDYNARDSIPALIARVVQAIRSASDPSTVTHFFGYHICSAAVTRYDHCHWIDSVTSDEAKELAGHMLTCEKQKDWRSLTQRPHLRSQQLTAALSAFENADANFHSEIDPLFGIVCVLPSLSDSVKSIRRKACSAVASAMIHLSEDKVVENVRRRLAPLTGNNKTVYRSWYESKVMSGGLDESVSTVESRTWDDAHTSVRHDTLLCWCIIAETTCTRGILQQVLFDIISAAVEDPCIEELCFLAIERIALRCGYSDVDMLLQSEMRDFAQRWLDSRWSFHQIPLMICMPSAYKRVIQAGRFLSLKSEGMGYNNESDLDTQKVYETAIDIFLRRQARYFFPQIIVSTMANVTQKGATREGRRFLLDNDYFREYCFAMYGSYNDEVAKKALCSLMPLVMAEAAFVEQNIADNLVLLMKGILTEKVWQTKCEACACLSFRRALEIVGEATSPAELDSVENFWLLSRLIELNCQKSGIIMLQSARCSVPELLIFVRAYLDRSQTERQMRSRWRSADAVLRIVIDDGQAMPSFVVAFCLDFLLSIISSQFFAPIRTHALKIIEEVLPLLKKAIDDSDFRRGTILKTMFGGLLNLHRRCQIDLMARCMEIWNRREKFRFRGATLIAESYEMSNATGFWDWIPISGPTSLDTPFAEIWMFCNRQVPTTLVEQLVTSHDVLRLVVRESMSLDILPEVIGSFRVEPREASIFNQLSLIDTSFSAQKLLSEHVTEKLSIQDFDMKELRRMSEDSRAVESAQIQTELEGLEQVLRCLRTQSWNGNSQMNGYQERDLILILASFCSSSHTETTRITASRCLAEISVSDDFINESTHVLSNKDNRLSDAIARGGLLVFVQSLTVEAIAASVNVTDSTTALIAFDTLKCLLSTKTGRYCTDWLRETTNSSDSLVQTISKTKSSNCSRLFLNEYEVVELRGSIRGSYEGNSKTWCWNDLFWTHDPRILSFESWISRLVPALLVCCYERPTKKNTDGKLDIFFPACQRLCSREPDVACAIFPAIVLDLLLRECDHNNDVLVDAVLTDTWIGQCDGATNIQISRCLNLLLRHGPDGKNSRAIGLVVEMLDMLRRLTQHRFVTSINHKTNKRRNKDAAARTPNTTTTCEKEKVLWYGAPYGVVVHLDGLLVANACIRSRRFESAIFFAELFADVRFGGPQRASNVERRRFPSSSRYICGFGENDNKNVEIRDDVVSYFEILRQSFEATGDENSREAIDQLESGFNFNTDQDYMASTLSLIRDPPSFQKLLLLDNASVRGVNKGKIQLPILNCLDGLGFHGLLETYIRDLTATVYNDSHGALEDKELMREKMFECRIYTMQWDDPEFNSLNKCADRDMENRHANGDISFSSIVTADSRSSRFNIEDQSTGAGFYEKVAMALDTMKRGDCEISQKCLLDARLRFVDGLTMFGSEMSICRNISFFIDHLRTLNDLEDYIRSPESKESLQRIIMPVDSVRGSSYNRSSFSDCVRTVVMNLLRTNESVWNSVSDTLFDGYKLQFQRHLDSSRYQAAQESFYRLDSIRSSKNNPSLRLELRLHEAKLLESKNDFNTAIRNAKLIINNLQESLSDGENECLLADAHLLCGQWMAKHKVAPASSILANYLQPAAARALRIYGIDNNISHANRATRALIAEGQLASNLFDAVSSRITSADWHKAELSLTEREVECKKLYNEAERNKLNTHADQMYRQYLEREIRATRTQREAIVGSLETYRTQAVKSIATALTIAGEIGPEDTSKLVYRLVGILFTSETNWSKSIDDVANDAIQSIPTFRFVPLINQLLSRISSTKGIRKSTFQNRLQTLIQKVSFDHPYHCLIHLISLSESRSGVETETNDKAEGANLILSVLMRDDPDFRAQLIESYRKLSHAYIHLATTSAPELKQANISFDKVCKTSSCRLDKCLGSGTRKAKYVPCIFTKPPKISPSKDYGDGIEEPNGSEFVNTFESTFAITDSGVNQPKIVVCIGSLQGRFKQLVKGADDTRQDAVMEQLFGYANEILKRPRNLNSKGIPVPSTSELRLFTYNIVPLSHVAGVLEWVDHSIPFGDFIVDKITRSSQDRPATRKIGAHSRYFPTEWSSDYCRQIISQLWKECDGSENEGGDGFDRSKKLRDAFEMIYDHHSPVFRFFFVENFLTPEIWYASKLRYTRSVAVSSIVGHILGIGDRHMSNILVHQKTGEVIHIDFGIVFEQGKRLRIPENVPFRLTRNVVDGMGPMGVEGTFTKAAEDTLFALKENANGLLTILSAIVSDPLYKWSISSKKVSRRNAVDHGGDIEVEEYFPDQGNHNIYNIGDENRNEVAAHAISRIHDKLLGYEDGTSGEQQSVESQVQLLINASQDIDNLCVMFVGWAPFE